MVSYKIGTLLGRLANGYESDRGKLYHAVDGSISLCGKRPGSRSAGWKTDEEGAQVTCPRCLKKMKKLQDSENYSDTNPKGDSMKSEEEVIKKVTTEDGKIIVQTKDAISFSDDGGFWNSMPTPSVPDLGAIMDLDEDE